MSHEWRWHLTKTWPAWTACTEDVLPVSHNVIESLQASLFRATVMDTVGLWLTGTGPFGTAAGTDVVVLFTKVACKECENASSQLGLHETIIGSPSQQLVVRLRHVDIVELCDNLLLQQCWQHTLNDALTNFVRHRLQARHHVEYVTDRLSYTLQNVINSSITLYSEQ